jgi:hypothetical protein
MSTPKTEMDFVDNTGATVTTMVSDPDTATRLECPAAGERPSAPDSQLEGPPMPDWADIVGSS